MLTNFFLLDISCNNPGLHPLKEGRKEGRKERRGQ
jgi:hypothetical protein